MYNNFQEYVNIRTAVEQYGAFVIEEGFDWTKDFQAPNLNLDLPVTDKSSKIAILMQKRNPIFMQLSDKTKLFFTPQEFRRIDGVPKVGKIAKITFLRLPQDQSEFPSQITKCSIL